MRLTNVLIYTLYMGQNMRPAVSGFHKCSRFNEHRRRKYCTPGGRRGRQAEYSTAELIRLIDWTLWFLIALMKN